MEKTTDWTVIKLLNRTIEHLQSRGFPSSRADAELLLGHVLGYKRLDLYLHFDESVLPAQLAQYRDIIRRRLRCEPVQYITGETEFYSLTFQVNPGVLIPRPETEILIDKAVQFCRERWHEPGQINLLDVGAGSGNIAVCLAKNLPNSIVDALDISDRALEVAQKNAERHNVDSSIRFHQASLFELSETAWQNLNAVISNPPYVSAEEYRQLPDEIRSYEPKEALYDGGSGFRFYPELCKRARNWLQSGGFLMIEAAMGGAPRVGKIFQECGFNNITTFKDLNQIDRVVCGWKP